MNIRKFSRRLFDLDAAYPRTIIAGVLLITVILGWKIFTLELDPGVRSMLPRDHEIVRSMEKVDELFSGSDIIIIAVESDSLFSSNTLQKLNTFQNSFETLDLISKVTSIFTQKHIIPDKGGFEIEPLLVDFPKDSADFADFKSKLISAGMMNHLVSSDFRTICFIGQINSSFEYDEFEFRTTIFELVNRFNSPENFYVASFPITRVTIIENMQRDLRVLLQLHWDWEFCYL